MPKGGKPYKAPNTGPSKRGPNPFAGVMRMKVMKEPFGPMAQKMKKERMARRKPADEDE